MSSLSLVIVLLLFTVSSHACTARPLTTTKPTANKGHFQQEVEKDKDRVKLLETITTSSNLKLKEDVYGEESCSSTSTWKQMVLDLTSGASFQTDSLSYLATKEERRHAETRSLLGPANHHHAQETEEEEEAIVQMDYAQPHRKPPIHNNKP